MNIVLAWHGDKIKKETVKVSKKAVKLTADQTAKASKSEYPVDTGGTKESIKVTEWEKDNAVGAYVNVGEKGRQHIAIFKELGTVDQDPDPILRRNLKKAYNNFRKAMTNKL